MNWHVHWFGKPKPFTNGRIIKTCRCGAVKVLKAKKPSNSILKG